MSARDERSTNLENILAEEKVDHESDTVVQQQEKEDHQPLPTWRERPHAPNPFPESSAVATPPAFTALRDTQGLEPGVITNRLDDQEEEYVMAGAIACQMSQIAATLRARRDYVFCPPTVDERLREVARQPLSGWIIDPAATSPLKEPIVKVTNHSF